MNIAILTDFHRGSYKIIGELFSQSLQDFANITHLPTPETAESREEIIRNHAGSVVFHNTLGEGFSPIPNCYNIALPFHEWSEYPKKWIQLLNQFDEVWTTTKHVLEVLRRGRLSVPVFKLPPALNIEKIHHKSNWNLSEKPKFFFVGEPHFRKGHHLLIQGFIKTFTNTGEALLTIKTSINCNWESPREDIILIKERWSRERLLSEYSKHDCFISASLGEGLGLPITEAIISGLPVCTNFWGGHKSIVTEGGFVEIEHEEIIQPFTSDPAFYSEGQKCAYSSPKKISMSIQKFLNTTCLEREKMAMSAKQNLLKTYGKENALNKINSRILEISKIF